MKIWGVQIEDKLSVQQVKKVLAFWRDVFGHFEFPRFVPKNMTEIIKVVDRHIGIQYKLAIYKRFRIEIMKWLQEAHKGARTVDGVTLHLMSPAEKRTLITKVVAECHERHTHPRARLG